MTVKEKLLKAARTAGSIEAQYKDDKGSGEYQHAKEIGNLIRSALKSLGC